MVGRLEAHVGGRPCFVEGHDDHIVVTIPRLRDALDIARASRGMVTHLRTACARSQLRVELRVGRRVRLTLAPQPHWLVRWLLPELRA